MKIQQSIITLFVACNLASSAVGRVAPQGSLTEPHTVHHKTPNPQRYLMMGGMTGRSRDPCKSYRSKKSQKSMVATQVCDRFQEEGKDPCAAITDKKQKKQCYIDNHQDKTPTSAPTKHKKPNPKSKHNDPCKSYRSKKSQKSMIATQVCDRFQKQGKDPCAAIKDKKKRKQCYIDNLTTESPTHSPSASSSQTPSQAPTDATTAPTTSPSASPSTSPSQSPTDTTIAPTTSPSQSPTDKTVSPSTSPSQTPTETTIAPTSSPSQTPSPKLRATSPPTDDNTSGWFWINGKRNEESLEMGQWVDHHKLSGFRVRLRQTNTAKRNVNIHLGQGDLISIQTYHDILNVEVNHKDAAHYMGATGLMGSFPTGAHVARDGVTVIESANDFGQEWQVKEDELHLFHAVEGPQAPQQCQLPSVNKEQSLRLRRRLGEAKVSMKAAKNACKSLTNGNEYKDCVDDVLVTQDLGAAEIWVLN
ncbi:unknown protein [Seminavis robusta]|uniref:VWFD domain-containing protein n=1 Tax=Seminavis robusta TaxID=568900 RepID=A0A9N8DCD1_9STRA|nr:unknown protein [Seminavis robusta]|eukprot:Sro27_g018420.1 n/a (474) ;mRNA; r:151283-153043